MAPNALSLMKSRYSAYAADLPDYIIGTTHPDNPEFSEEKELWRNSIREFSRQTTFLDLKIIEQEEGEEEAYITFVATLSSGQLKERSRFLKVAGKWLYVDGIFETQAAL